jgi:hypothetical protein
MNVSFFVPTGFVSADHIRSLPRRRNGLLQTPIDLLRVAGFQLSLLPADGLTLQWMV